MCEDMEDMEDWEYGLDTGASLRPYGQEGQDTLSQGLEISSALLPSPLDSGLSLAMFREEAADWSDPLTTVKSVREHKLPAHWAPMPGGETFLEVDLLAAADADPSKASECVDVLASVFKSVNVDKSATLAQALEKIHGSSNYKVCGIKRVQNTTLFRISKAFAEAHGISEKKTVLHGTVKGTSISRSGFSTRHQRDGRALYGKGIYCSEHFGVSILYANPCQKWVQTLIVSTMAQGETRRGYKDMVDLGTNPDNGKPYLTMQNEDGKILAASEGAQLYPEYVVEVQFDFEKTYTKDNSVTGYVHPEVWKEVKRRGAGGNPQDTGIPQPVRAGGAPAAGVAATPAVKPSTKTYKSKSVSDGTQKSEWMGFKVGEKVRIKNHYSCYATFSEGEEGTIMQIEKQRVWLFFVLLDNPLVRELVKKVKKDKYIPLAWRKEEEWLPCKHWQLSKDIGPAAGAAKT